MKAIAVVLLLSGLSFAGIFRESSRVVEGSAKLAYKAAKPPAKLAYRASKSGANLSSYPVRHPVKSAKRSAKVAKAVVY